MTADTRREERLAENETIFRLVNERIAEMERHLGDAVRHEFICECSTTNCFERIAMTLVEYEAIRADGSHFFVLGGHEDIEIEQVIVVHDSFVVVQKDGAAGILAVDEDPRAGRGRRAARPAFR
jgi:hypothetical protein